MDLLCHGRPTRCATPVLGVQPAHSLGGGSRSSKCPSLSRDTCSALVCPHGHPSAATSSMLGAMGREKALGHPGEGTVSVTSFYLFLNNRREKPGTRPESQVTTLCFPDTCPRPGLPCWDCQAHTPRGALYSPARCPGASQAEKRQSHVKIGIIQRRTHQDHELVEEHGNFPAGSCRAPWLWSAQRVEPISAPLLPQQTPSRTFQDHFLYVKPNANCLANSGLGSHTGSTFPGERSPHAVGGRKSAGACQGFSRPRI